MLFMLWLFSRQQLWQLFRCDAFLLQLTQQAPPAAALLYLPAVFMQTQDRLGIVSGAVEPKVVAKTWP